MLGLFDRTDEWREALAKWEGIPQSPPKEYRKRRRGFKVMKNTFLEKYFATSHWVMPGVWFVPVIAACVYAALTIHGLSPVKTSVLFVVGALGWTFVEYLLHRWLFHLPPSKHATIKEIQYMLHGYHHDFPDDPGRLVAPPVLSWPIAAPLALLYVMLFGDSWAALFGGTVAGYLGYDWMHYYTHHAVPRNPLGRFMRRFHLEHHFKQAHSQFGLSSPLWDLLLGTFWTTKALKTKDAWGAGDEG
jgi:sterol desaturase/sphingolipid hydroxylase (fatty acid hydroxylase superfamily)